MTAEPPVLIAGRRHSAAPAVTAAEWTLPLTILTCCAMVLLASRLLRIEEATRVVLPWADVALPGVCWFRFFDLHCPGCGLTRSFISFAHGQWLAAWQYNAAGPPLYLLVAGQIPYQCCQLWRQYRGWPAWRLGKYGTAPLVAFTGALFAQWLVRMCAHFVG